MLPRGGFCTKASGKDLTSWGGLPLFAPWLPPGAGLLSYNDFPTQGLLPKPCIPKQQISKIPDNKRPHTLSIEPDSDVSPPSHPRSPCSCHVATPWYQAPFKQLSLPFLDSPSMRNPRFLIPGGIHFITFRTEEGLPFVPLQFMNILICSALARAQRLYPIRIICFVVQANHVHLLIRVTNPEEVSSFIRYFKAESAHYLNRLLNRRQRTVWAERFDSPAVLDIDKALELFAYCSLNPVKDGLVGSMREYPGVASYPFLMKGQDSIPAKSIPRDRVTPLADPTNPQRENKNLSHYFTSDALSNQISPARTDLLPRLPSFNMEQFDQQVWVIRANPSPHHAKCPSRQTRGAPPPSFPG